MEQKFKVIYTGRLSDDVDETTAAERFGTLFKIPHAKALKIIQAPKEVVLQPGLEHVKAYKLKAALENLGMQMRLERASVPKPEAHSDVKAKPTTMAPTEQTPEPESEPSQKLNAPSKSQPEPAQKQAKPISTAELSLEPITEDHPEESDSIDEPQLTSDQVQQNKHTPASEVDSPDWELEPVSEDPASEEALETNDDPDALTPEQPEYVDLSKPTAQVNKTETDSSKETITKNPSPPPQENAFLAFIKQFGGIIVAGLVGLFFLLKKFGLLKFLKIGGLMAAAAYAGYNPEEACMGNGACEDAVDDQIDACWSYSELDQHDWDNMDGDQFLKLKPQIEEKFIGCFRYKETGGMVFENPIDLRNELISLCETQASAPNCLASVEPQIKTCYARSEIGDYVQANNYDYIQTIITNMHAVRDFYACFEDDSGKRLFPEMVDQMDLDIINKESE